jgi:hypothetical protein
MTARSLSLAVVGADYQNKRGPGRRFELNICKPGEPIELVREPKNPADENAVAVFSCRNVQLGYLTAERAPLIGRMIANGREIRAIFQRQTHFGAWIRLAFDGEVPVLPPDRSSDNTVDDTDQDSGFYPDPIYPDE